MRTKTLQHNIMTGFLDNFIPCANGVEFSKVFHAEHCESLHYRSRTEIHYLRCASGAALSLDVLFAGIGRCDAILC